MDCSPGEVTRLIELEEGRQDAAPRLFELFYDQLRRMARRHLHNELPDHTLPATALVDLDRVPLHGELASRASAP